jgi:phosphatidate cytidylyltransferase
VLRARLATAAVAIPLLLLLIFAAPAWLFAAVVGLIAIAGVGEYANMAFARHAGQRHVTVALGVMVVAAMAFGERGSHVYAALTGMLLLGFFWTLTARSDFEQGLVDLATTVLGVLYAGFVLMHIVWLHEQPHGGEWITFILMAVMMGDTGGYFIGHAVGRHKLSPRISPGKTVEGSMGIMLASLLAGVVAYWWPYSYIACGEAFLGWSEALVLSAMIGVIGQIGDLSESIMKRTFGVKESGWIFPGHGGVLDRIDSVLFSVVLVYYYCLLLR